MVERLYRTLKTSLKAQDNSHAWYDNLPWVLLALRNSPKQDLNQFSPSDLVFGQPVRLPGDFFHPHLEEQQFTHGYVRNFAKFISSLTYNEPRSPKRNSYINPVLLSPDCSHVYVRVDAHKSPLSNCYKGPYRVMEKRRKYFRIDLRTHEDNVSIDRLKPAYLSISTLNAGLTAGPSHSLDTSVGYTPVPQVPPVSQEEQVSQSLPPFQATQHFTRSGRAVNVPNRFSDYVL